MDITCPHCKNTVFSLDTYCGHCGKKLRLQHDVKEKNSLRLVLGFYISYLIFAIVSYALLEEDFSLGTEIAIEAVFILLTLLFTFFDAKNVFALYNIKQLDWKNILFSIIFPMFSAVLVYYSVGWLNDWLVGMPDNLFYDYEAYTNAFFWILIFYTIIPPIFEELAFRGFLFNQLRIIASPSVTILATAFIFALVHFSWISILWIFPFGIVLGYLRHKYNTLWLGMIIHFIHNLLVVLMDYYYYNIDTYLEF
jgi:membrane protease YdiL (CAAX protease family)